MNWNYIAGFFDGEGCISVAGRNNQIRLIISQVRSKVLYDIAEFLKLSGIKCRIETRERNYKSANPISNLIVDGMYSVHTMLTSMHDSLIVKRDEATYALTILQAKLDKKAEFLKRVDKAIADYISNESSLVVSHKHGIAHVTLMAHMRRRGLEPRTRSASAVLGLTKRRQDYRDYLSRRMLEINQGRCTKRAHDLAGAEILHKEGASIKSLAKVYHTNYPRMRSYLISIGEWVPTPRVQISSRPSA